MAEGDGATAHFAEADTGGPIETKEGDAEAAAKVERQRIRDKEKWRERRERGRSSGSMQRGCEHLKPSHSRVC